MSNFSFEEKDNNRIIIHDNNTSRHFELIVPKKLIAEDLGI